MLGEQTASNADPGPSTSRGKPLYEGSTQFRNWRFSPERLAHMRERMNANAVAAIRAAFEADEPGSSSAVQFLIPDEELLLVKLYASKIPQMCQLFRFPEEVEATAISYMKRFYLKNTVMDWHPKNVMLTALFLATKTTNNPISIEHYTKIIPRVEVSDVLDIEFLVAQSLGFEFTVWHAHRALWGIWLDLQTIPDATPLDQAIYQTALARVAESRLTDAEFIYTPSQIAHACLAMVAPNLAEQWTESKYPSSSPEKAASATIVRDAIATLRTIITSEGHAPPIEAVREVDRRLKLCKNPEKIPGSKAFLNRKAEEERKFEEKRQRKLKAATTGSDPFGDSLAEGDLDDDDDD
ncbi:cyclin-like protein [Schizophyllum amplum]|uniref:Cyclin-like protein n=1 Tax=Schizophyllum amplum TaxID=97359 RepID=A0A550CLV9_9AGAR|nr:cyclin-like protein [Auriculariopsis ampla]